MGSGLEWLDLTATTDRSYNDISSKFGSGQEFDGWRYATQAEVEGFLDAFGGDNAHYDGWSTQNNGLFDKVASYWGDTCAAYSCSPYGARVTWFITDKTDPDAIIPSHKTGTMHDVQSDINNWPAETEDYVNIDFISRHDNFSHGLYGSALVRVSAVSSPPTAEAGDNKSIHVGQNVILDGSESMDDNTDTEDLLYAWRFFSQPTGSTAVLVDADTSSANFIADLLGEYVVNLVVTDEDELASEPDSVTISSLNSPPTANAGSSQGTYVGNTVVLNGSASSDSDDDTITYSWAFNGWPVGSLATLSDADSASPTFIPDLPGTYDVELVVNDDYADSTPDEVSLTVITGESYAEQKLIEAINSISVMPIDSFTKKGNQEKLIKNFEKAIKELQGGNIEKAVKELEKVVENVDGCALRGTPDDKDTPKVDGKKFKKDIISNCTDQAAVYLILMDAFNALTL